MFSSAPWTLAGSCLLAVALSAPSSAFAEEPLEDIEVGTSRLGGSSRTAGKSASDVREEALDAEAEAEATLTEDNLPPKGHPKRLPGLHIIAKRYVGGRMWKEACDRFDQIVDEGGGDAALDTSANPKNPDAKKNAWRSYFVCAEQAFAVGDFDKTEVLLKKSERLGPSEDRHKTLRRKIQRESYKKALASGDVERALAGYDQYQAGGTDEDERIWMGDQLAHMAWESYKTKDKLRMERMIGHATRIAPMNPDLRKLQDKIETEDTVVGRMILIGIASIALVLALTRFAKWRAAAKVRKIAGEFGD